MKAPAAAVGHRRRRSDPDPQDAPPVGRPGDHPGGGDRWLVRVLRLDPVAVLRRRGRQRGRDLPGRQRAVRPGEVLQRGREHRPQAVRPEPRRPDAGRGRHHRPLAAEAEQIKANLLEQRLQLCPTPTPLPTSSPSPVPTITGQEQLPPTATPTPSPSPTSTPTRRRAGYARMSMTATVGKDPKGPRRRPRRPDGGPNWHAAVFAVGRRDRGRGRGRGDARGHVNSHLLTYGLVPLALALVAHLIVRRFAAYADPLLLPCAVLLNGLGPGDDPPPRPSDWNSRRARHGRPFAGRRRARPRSSGPRSASLLFIAILLIVVRDHRVLQRYAYTLALIGLFLLVLPAVLPARFSEVNGARIWIRVAGFSIQPGEFAKILLTIFAAAYLVTKRDVLSLAGRRVPRPGPAPRARLRAVAAGLADLHRRPRPRPRPRHLADVLRRVRRAALRRDRASQLGHHRPVHVRRRRLRRLPAVRQRADPGLGLADMSSPTPTAAGYQVAQSLFGLGTGGLFGTGLGGGHPEIVPLPATDFILSSFGEETRPVRAGRLAAHLRPVRRARLCGRAGRPRLVRQAARHGPGVPRSGCSCSSWWPASPGCCPRPA